MKKLTKEDILRGKDRREAVHVEGYDAEVVIRPLTDGELSEVFAIAGAGEPGKPDPSRNFKALRLVTSMGMVEPKLTPEEVAEMKFGVPEAIGTRILELSGIVPGASVKKKNRDG